MTSFIRAIQQQPFVRYLRQQPLEPHPAPAGGADAVAPDLGAHAAPNAPTHLADIENGWLADKSRKAAKAAGWMSLMRLASNNSPLLAVPDFAAAKAADFISGLAHPAALVGYGFKDVVCRAVEDFNVNATYATRIARWSSRALACAWFTGVEGLSWADVGAWMGRPDYEYPADCNPHDLSPVPDPHCPVLAVGQRAETIEPVVGAVLLGAAMLTVSWGIYRFDRALRCPAAPPRESDALSEASDRGVLPPNDLALEEPGAALGEANHESHEGDNDVELGQLQEPLLNREHAPG